MSLKVITVLAAVGFLFVSSNTLAATERIFNLNGQGYRDATFNERGGLIGETLYNPIGQKLRAVAVHSELGNVSEIKYENGQPKIKAVKEIAGRVLREDRFDKKGRVAERTLYDDTGAVLVFRYHYDGKGRVILVVKQRPGGGLIESVDYVYEGERLRSALRRRLQMNGSEKSDELVMDDAGAVVKETGDTAGILEDSRVPSDPLPPSSRESFDSNGNRFWSKGYSDGVHEITVFDQQGRVISWQRLKPDECPASELCPHIIEE